METTQVGAMPKSQKAQFENMLRTFFQMKNSKFRNIQRVPLVLGKRFTSSNIACWNKWVRLFSNLRLLLSKTQYSSDIAQYSRNSTASIVERNLRPIVLKKVIGYIMKKPNLRQKNFNIHSVAKYQKLKKRLLCCNQKIIEKIS